MTPLGSSQNTILTTAVRVRPDSSIAFADWQANLHHVIASFPAFVSLEILSPLPPHKEWMIIQRFIDPDAITKWQRSPERAELLKNLAPLLVDPTKLEESISDANDLQAGVTEVFVTEVHPNRERDYREWVAKIHQAEAKFPGFRGFYVQSPTQANGKNWITLLQFDTPQNLDRWLVSPERQAVLADSTSMIAAIENHRIISPYAGWFSSLTKQGGAIPPVWKQTMIILLVLFPIVMLEIKYLNPWINFLPISPRTFLGNAISVTLVSWPTMPIAIYFLRWWLTPQREDYKRMTYIGTAVVCLLYAIEVVLLSFLF
ncbi:MAG: antibiotic biosynthesis monooxygenase [Parachlamydiaceae bacterium]|nr:antibiotic biosynthesis monooxygenase [Parachlamydiaceae bacterium]